MALTRTPADKGDAAGNWLTTAIAHIEADYQRSADTHLMALPMPEFAARGIDFCLKHRLARSHTHDDAGRFDGCRAAQQKIAQSMKAWHAA